MKKNRGPVVPAIGGSSLLVIFSVLCLTIFSLLSFSTALAEKRTADASAQAVTNYYEADLAAERIFARLRAGEQVGNVQVKENSYRYTCPVAENQVLEVELRKETDGWQICRWQVVVGNLPISETLPVWNGN